MLEQRDICYEDETILKRFVPLSSVAYEHNFGYILQACRYDGFKILDESLLLFGGYKSPRREAVIIATFFGDYGKICKAAKEISEKKCLPVIFKNISVQDIDSFKRNGFREYRIDEYWDQNAPFDDQTYSQVLVDIEPIVINRGKGRKYKKLRKAINHPESLSLQLVEVADFQKEIETLLLANGKSIYDSHTIYLRPLPSLDKWIVLNNGQFAGFMVSSPISQKVLAVNASIFDLRGTKTISIWATYTIFVSKFKEGYKQANLGGKETESCHNFEKEKFRPDLISLKNMERTHLIYP